MTGSIVSPFEHFTIPAGFNLRNRIAMAPMTTWAAQADGSVSDDEIHYYRRRARDVGLVITGCTHVQPNGIGFTNEFASYNDRFLPGLRRLAAAAKSGGAPAVLQIFHAGNKANASLIADRDVVSASACSAAAGPFNDGHTEARELRHDEILEVIEAFGAATERAIEAGFDGIELHGAHGFLLQNFLSPLTNRRQDEWGGSFENRLRFPLAVLREVKMVADRYACRPFLIGYRISPEEHEEGGLRLADTQQLIDRLIGAGVGYVHLSLPNLLNASPIGQEDGVLIAKLVVDRVAGRVPVVAAGGVENSIQLERAVELGLSLVAVARALVANPDWVKLVANGDGRTNIAAIDPKAVEAQAIPEKLWGIIQSRSGWFRIAQPA